MLLIEWTEARKFIYAALCLAPSFVLFLNAHGRKDKLVPLLSAVPTVIFCSVFVLWGFAIAAANDDLPAVYSPDGRFAARVSIGPFGQQVVELFSWHGLRKDVVYRGPTDDERTLHWTNDRTLEIRVGGSSDLCKSAGNVEVVCAPLMR